jgi:SAM-dependent methyltransferase
MLLKMLKSVMARPQAQAAPQAIEPVKWAEATFRNPHYQRHNARRQEHLATLGLDLARHTVLEVGAGVGDHTTFFLDRDCKVVSVEPRPENCELFAATMVKHRRMGYDKAADCTLIEADVESVGDKVSGTFDIVYCYGLLYHVEDPGAVLAALAQRCGDLLLLETRVSSGGSEAIHPVLEDKALPSNTVHGKGCQPTRPWILHCLKGLFPHVYVPRTQPAHEEFPLDWAVDFPASRIARAVFIASRRPLDNPKLLDRLPERQTWE